MEKERYLTHLNRGKLTHKWLRDCSAIRRTPIPAADPGRTALLVLDMQGFFLDPEAHAFIPSASALFAPITSMVASFYRNGETVVFTRHISSEDPGDPMRRRWPGAMKISDPLSAISSRLDASRGIILNKHAFSAFFNTELETLLRTRKITRLVITGVMTHLCCDTTARDAFMRGFDILFTVDGTATYSESLHLGTLKALAHGFATCISSREVLS